MTAAPAAPLRALHDRYTFEYLLGRSGIATAYLTHNLQNGPAVAGMVPRSDPVPIPGAERFDREMRIDSSPGHFNILPVLDAPLGNSRAEYAPFVVGEAVGPVSHRGIP